MRALEVRERARAPRCVCVSECGKRALCMCANKRRQRRLYLEEAAEVKIRKWGPVRAEGGSGGRVVEKATAPFAQFLDA